MNKNYSLAAAILLAAGPLAAHAQTAAPVPATTAAPAAPATAAQPVTLRLKFTPGQTLYYTLTSDTNGTILTGQSGAGMPIQVHMQMLMHQTVKDVRASDGAATLDVGIDTMTMGMNGQTMPLPAEKLAQMKTVGTMTILPTGKTLSFTPSAGLSAAGPMMPGMDMSHMNAMGSLGQFPDGPLKLGDTWKSAVAAGMMGMQVASGFSLASLDTTGGATIALIKQTINGTFDTSAAGGAGAATPEGLAMTGTVTGTGTLRFDVDAGAVAGQTSHANVTITMTRPGTDTPMKMQMKANSTLARASAPTAAANPAVQ